MADAEVAAGFSIGELLLGAKVDLFARLDSIEKRLQDIQVQEERYQDAGPTFVALQGSANLGSDTPPPTAIDLGGPQYGRVWEVRAVIVGGITWATTVAGVAQLVPSPTCPSAAVPVGMCQDVISTLPASKFYSSGQFRVIHPNHIFILIVGGTASTVYTVGGDALDLPAVPLRGYTAE